MMSPRNLVCQRLLRSSSRRACRKALWRPRRWSDMAGETADRGRILLPALRSSHRVTPARPADASLARYFLEVDIAGPVTPLRQLAKASGASLGSMHAAFARLEEAGIITLERRGHLGTFLTARDLGGLWSTAEGAPCVIALPPSHTRRYDGLATGLKRELLAAGVETFFIFLAGSRDRLRALQQGLYTVTLMSALAADELCGEGETVLHSLPAGKLREGAPAFRPSSSDTRACPNSVRSSTSIRSISRSCWSSRATSSQAT